jgi:hypothetical protein
MNSTRLVLVASIPLVALTALALARSTAQSPSTRGSMDPARVLSESGGEIATLYANDPLGWSLSLRDGGPGQLVQDHAVRNRDSTIAFDAYDRDSFTVGVQGGEMAAIADLGPLRDLGERIGIAETVGAGQGWAAIAMKNGELGLITGGNKFTTWSPETLVPAWSELKTSAHVPVRAGHAYLVRSLNVEAGCVAKIIVLAHEPGVSVTIRWVRIDS